MCSKFCIWSVEFLEILKDIIIPILTSIIGAITGVLIERLISKEKDPEKILNKYELNFNNIHIQQNEKIKEVVRYRSRPHKSKTSSELGPWEVIIGLLFIGLLLIWFYLKYEQQIIYGVLLASLFILFASLAAIFRMIKTKISFDSKFKSIVLWISISTILIPIELYFLKRPLFFEYVNKSEVLETMKTEGFTKILTKYNLNTFWFLLYQVFGVILALFSISLLIIGILHVWSMINLTLQNKMLKFWRFIYRITYSFVKSSKFYIIFSLFILILSFLFSSGILANLVLINMPR